MAWLNRFGWLIGTKDTQAKVVMVGLTNSGKSTIMRQLKPRQCQLLELTPNIPIGLNAECFRYKTLTFVAFDLGDQNGIGNPWEDHFRDCEGVIFIVDSADQMNIPLVRIHLEKVLQNPLLRRKQDVPLLILGSKADQPGSMSSLQLSHVLELPQLVGTRSWQVFCCDGLTGDGFGEALDWLAYRLREVCGSKEFK